MTTHQGQVRAFYTTPDAPIGPRGVRGQYHVAALGELPETVISLPQIAVLYVLPANSPHAIRVVRNITPIPGKRLDPNNIDHVVLKLNGSDLRFYNGGRKFSSLDSAAMYAGNALVSPSEQAVLVAVSPKTQKSSPFACSFEAYLTQYLDRVTKTGKKRRGNSLKSKHKQRG
ncbi:hypothetical protein J4470_05555 [Candidatus Woesearchaeota archaeon]|nr:hypothetical protein [Candidatus Woesearchaeota archaeon]